MINNTWAIMLFVTVAVPVVSTVQDRIDVYCLFSALVLSLIGGAVGGMLKDQDSTDLRKILTHDIFVSVFAGIVIFFVLENYTEISYHWKCFAYAMCGFCAERVLMIFKAFFEHKALNKFIIKSDNKDKIGGKDGDS